MICDGWTLCEKFESHCRGGCHRQEFRSNPAKLTTGNGRSAGNPFAGRYRIYKLIENWLLLQRFSSLVENPEILVVSVNAAVIAPGGFAGNAEFGQVFEDRLLHQRFCYAVYYAIKRYYLVSLLFPLPERVTITPHTTDVFLTLQSVENMAEHVATDTGTNPLNLCDADLARERVDGLLHKGRFRPARRFDLTSAFLKLGVAAGGLAEGVQVFERARCDGQFLVTGVDFIQRAAVALHFLLGAVTRSGVAEDERTQAVGRDRDAFNTVGGFGALDDGGFAERLEHLRRLPGEQFLFALGLGNVIEQPRRAHGQRMVAKAVVAE